MRAHIITDIGTYDYPVEDLAELLAEIYLDYNNYNEDNEIELLDQFIFELTKLRDNI